MMFVVEGFVGLGRNKKAHGRQYDVFVGLLALYSVDDSANANDAEF